MNSTGSDKSLVERCCSGDQAAWVALFEIYGGRIKGRALTLVGDQQDAEDIAQDVLSKLARGALERWNGEKGPLLSFLYWLTHNASVDHLRRQNRRVPQVPLDTTWADTDDEMPDGRQYASPAAPLDEALLASEERLRLRRELSRLPGPDRDLLALRFDDEIKRGRLAATIGVSPPALDKRVQRALSRLKSRFK